MSAETLREQLHQYVETASEADLKVLLNHIECELPCDGDRWADPKFLAEVLLREQEVRDGTAQLLTWEEVKARARQRRSASKAA